MQSQSESEQQEHNHRNTQAEIGWRRGKVAELDSQGHNQPEIAAILHVSVGTICRDLGFLREQADITLQYKVD
jgi:DNA-binding NarL/FixJ family response regulator